MEKFFIKSREGKNISVILEKSEQAKGLAFVMHGLGGFKEQEHIITFAKAFSENAFTVVRFDTRNTIGESEGDYSDANFTNSYEDLEDVINWAKGEDWYKEPFVLAGHSLGSGCILWYAAHHPQELAGLAPISTVIGGAQTLARYRPEDLRQWDESGMQSKASNSKPGVMKELRWPQFKEDILQYDIVPEAHKLTMPVLMIVGDQDFGTPLEDQMKLYENIVGDKEIHSIKGGPHTFREVKHLEEIKEIFSNWIKNKVLK